MDHRRGKKGRLHLTARRKKNAGAKNLQKYRMDRDMGLLPSEHVLDGVNIAPISNIVERVDITEAMDIPHNPLALLVPPIAMEVDARPSEGIDAGPSEDVDAVVLADVHTLNVLYPASTSRQPLSQEHLIADVPLPQYTEGEEAIHGRRITSISYFLQALKLFEHCPMMGCTLENLDCIKENRTGLKSHFVMKCSMCNITQTISTADPYDPDTDVNIDAVIGIMNIGTGYTHLAAFCGALNIPCMTYATYKRYHDNVCDAWEAKAEEEMKKGAELEKSIAIGNGDVEVDGVPFITVVCDGTWAKRSYRTKYDSLSGVAVIVGLKTGKILHTDVKNKYCSICQRAEAKNEAPRSHRCFRNWTGSSSGMEAAGMVSGFMASEQKYGLRYKYMVADGDSSVYKKILEARPYKHLTVEKIECRNHLLRNYCNKIKDACSNTASGPPLLRKRVWAHHLRLRTAVTKAIAFRKGQETDIHTKTMELKKDILNGVSHVFGEHLNCLERIYFCTKVLPEEGNLMADLKGTVLHIKIMDHVRVVANHSRSLIFDVDSNTVEQFNSIVCKYISGKRINFCLNRSYQARVAAAVVSRNTGRPLYSIKKYLTGRSPTCFGTKAEQARAKKCNKNRNRSIFKTKRNPAVPDKDYGPECQKPDMQPEDYKEAELTFMNALQRTTEERSSLELRTRGQSASGEWLEIRRQLLTASNFGQVCCMLPHTSCRNIVKKLIYDDISAAALEYGTRHEPDAIKQLCETMGIKINQCGLFVDADIPYLGATPDGTIDGDPNGITEVKCPFGSRTLSPEDAIKQKKITFWKVETCQNTASTIYVVNKKHKWYFQVQGQLHITGRKYCLFAVWTPLGMKTESIERDDVFWEQNMKPKLVKFYINCMLPELVDPRISRSMVIRDPQYILDAKTVQTTKQLKQAKDKQAKKEKQPRT